MPAKCFKSLCRSLNLESAQKILTNHLLFYLCFGKNPKDAAINKNRQMIMTLRIENIEDNAWNTC